MNSYFWRIGVKRHLRNLAGVATAFSLLHPFISNATPSVAQGDKASSDTVIPLLERVLTRAVIFDVRYSADSKYLSYTYYRAVPETDEVEFTIAVVCVDAPRDSVIVADFRLPAQQAMDGDEPRPTAVDVRWAPSGSSLIYLAPDGPGAALYRWTPEGRNVAARVSAQHRSVEFSDSGSAAVLSFMTSDFADAMKKEGIPDRGLRIKDGYRFFGPLPNPSGSATVVRQTWNYSWTSGDARPSGPRLFGSEVAEPRNYAVVPLKTAPASGSEVYSVDDFPQPNGSIIARVTFGVEGLTDIYSTHRYRHVELIRAGNEAAFFALPENIRERCRRTGIGWSRGGSHFNILETCVTVSRIIAIDPNGTARTLISAPVLLSSKGESGKAATDPSGRFVALVRSSSFVADDLILVDLDSGRMQVIGAPNGETAMVEGITTTVIHTNDNVFNARLYLPKAAARRGARVPLVVALYYSGPGLEVSTGEETPILALVESGVAVLTFDAQDMTDGVGDGNARWEIARVERPRLAIEQVVRETIAHYGVDPGRIGIAGTSYGAEIAMYCYWKSSIFRAVSTTTGTLSPSWVPLGGLGYASRLAQRGLLDTDRPSESVWKSVSAALNARSNLPPLLWQSPDSERVVGEETWYRLRAASAPVEWWEYPNETHWKSSPANREAIQKRNLDWFRFWLQDYKDPAPEKRDQYGRWTEMRDGSRTKAAP